MHEYICMQSRKYMHAYLNTYIHRYVSMYQKFHTYIYKWRQSQLKGLPSHLLSNSQDLCFWGLFRFTLKGFDVHFQDAITSAYWCTDSCRNHDTSVTTYQKIVERKNKDQSMKIKLRCFKIVAKQLSSNSHIPKCLYQNG